MSSRGWAIFGTSLPYLSSVRGLANPDIFTESNWLERITSLSKSPFVDDFDKYFLVRLIELCTKTLPDVEDDQPIAIESDNPAIKIFERIKNSITHELVYKQSSYSFHLGARGLYQKASYPIVIITCSSPEDFSEVLLQTITQKFRLLVDLRQGDDEVS